MTAGSGSSGRPVRCLLIGEYTLGHVTFIDGLVASASRRDDLVLDVVRLPYEVSGLAGRLPVYRSNWSVRASVLARSHARTRRDNADVALVHTQTAALLLGPLMRSVPTWISCDATPHNFDEVGAAYGHGQASPWLERRKDAIVGRAYRAAHGVIPWSSWVAQSLVRDYNVAPDRLRTVPAGVTLPSLDDRSAQSAPRGPVRLLFVGGDFTRKGGHVLLGALARLHGDVQLDVVTQTDVPAGAGVVVHRGLRPGSPELQSLYRQADVAVLPTLGDASPFAVVEAMAYGLPVVTTAVGAVAETVTDGVDALVVPPDDAAALATALQRLVDDADLRSRLGRHGRMKAEERYDAKVNAGRVLDLVVESAP